MSDHNSNRERSTVERLRPWAPFLVGAGVVLVASLLPVPGALVGSGGGSGGAGAPLGPLAVLGPTGAFHLVGYAALTVLATLATGRDGRGLLLAAGAAVAFGFGIELLQAPIPWRSFAWGDAAVNAVGAAVGLVVVVAVEAGVALAAARGRRPR